jgi:hypothetical protein
VVSECGPLRCHSRTDQRGGEYQVGCKEEGREGLKATRIEDIWIIISRSEYNRLRPNCIRPRAVEIYFFFFNNYFISENK